MIQYFVLKNCSSDFNFEIVTYNIHSDLLFRSSSAHFFKYLSHSINLVTDWPKKWPQGGNKFVGDSTCILLLQGSISIGSSPINCDECVKTFSFRQVLYFHKNSVHEKIILFVTNVINRFRLDKDFVFIKTQYMKK